MMRLPLALLALVAACATDPAGPADLSPDALVLGLPDAVPGTRLSVAPSLKPGVDPVIFLPTVVAGYHPTAEELATSGRSCTLDADCATSGQVVFHCSTPYYGQAQCQGAFPPGDQVTPGATPSCLYYDCPAGFECSSEAESRSVTCLENQPSGGHDDAGSGHGGR